MTKYKTLRHKLKTRIFLRVSSILIAIQELGGPGYRVQNRLLNDINKQAGSLMIWSTSERISSETVQWIFPWEVHNYWIKIQMPFHYKMWNKDWMNYLKGNPINTMKSLPIWMQQKSKVGGLLHKYFTIISSSYTNNIVSLFYLGCLSHLCTAVTAATQIRQWTCSHSWKSKVYVMSPNATHDALWKAQKCGVVCKWMSLNFDLCKI